MVSSHNGILIKTKLTLCLNTIVVIRLRRQGSSINVPTLRRNALDPAPDPHTTGVSRKRIDNSDAAIHGLSEMWSTGLEIVVTLNHPRHCSFPDASASIRSVAVSIQLRFVKPHPIDRRFAKRAMFLVSEVFVPRPAERNHFRWWMGNRSCRTLRPKEIGGN